MKNVGFEISEVRSCGELKDGGNFVLGGRLIYPTNNTFWWTLASECDVLKVNKIISGIIG